MIKAMVCRFFDRFAVENPKLCPLVHSITHEEVAAAAISTASSQCCSRFDLNRLVFPTKPKSFKVVCSIASEHSRTQVTLSKTCSKAICLTKFPISALEDYSSPHHFLLSLCNHYCDTGRLSNCSVTRQVAGRLLGDTDHCQPLRSSCSFTEKNFEKV